MNLNLKQIVLFTTFIPVALSVMCYDCNSVTSSCSKPSVLTCTNGCMKFSGGAMGVNVEVKTCSPSTPYLGCRSDSYLGYSGTICYCNYDYCNQSSHGPRPRSFMAIFFAVVWIIIKILM